METQERCELLIDRTQSPFIHTTTLQSYFHLHLTVKETETQRNEEAAQATPATLPADAALAPVGALSRALGLNTEPCQ